MSPSPISTSHGVMGVPDGPRTTHCSTGRPKTFLGSDINISSSILRDCEIRELLTIMGEKVMQSHLTKTLKDGAIYEKDAAERSFVPSRDRTGLAV